MKDTWQGHVPDCRRGSARSEGASALTKLLPVRRATKKEGDQMHPSSVDDSITSSRQISSQRSQFFSLAGRLQNAAPDAVDGPLEFGSGCRSNLIQVRLGRPGHDQESCSAMRRTIGWLSSNLVAWQIGRTPGLNALFSETCRRLPAVPSVISRSIWPWPPAITGTGPRTTVIASRGT